MAGTGPKQPTPREFFCDRIGEVRDEGEYFRLTFCLHHQGEDVPIVEIIMPPTAYRALVQRVGEPPPAK